MQCIELLYCDAVYFTFCMTGVREFFNFTVTVLMLVTVAICRGNPESCAFR